MKLSGGGDPSTVNRIERAEYVGEDAAPEWLLNPDDRTRCIAASRTSEATHNVEAREISLGAARNGHPEMSQRFVWDVSDDEVFTVVDRQMTVNMLCAFLTVVT